MGNGFHNSHRGKGDGFSINDEYLLKTAAAEIFSNEYGDYTAAQKKYIDIISFPEYQYGKDRVIHAIDNHMRTIHRRHFFKQARRIIAIVAIGCVSIFSIVYTTVDAVRVSVDNFFLELGDGYAIIHQSGESGNPVLPDKWSNVLTPSWIPTRFKYVLGTDLEDMKELIYQSDDVDDFLSISAWTNGMVPYVDQEDLVFIKAVSLSGVPANLYKSSSTNRCALLFVKNNYTIHIAGTVSEEEIIKIGEGLDISGQ